MKRLTLIRGLATFLSFIGSIFLCAELVVESSVTYVGLVDSIFGGGQAISSSSAEAFMYQSDFENTSQFLKHRKEVAVQLAREGTVLLKNHNNGLPLKTSNSNSETKVTILGTRAYTYDKNGGLRDQGSNWSYSAYGGICGSRTYGQTVNNENGKESLPWTLIDSLALENIIANPSGVEVYTGKPFTNIPLGGEVSGSSGGPFSINEPRVSFSDFASGYSDAAIVMIGRSSGEGRDYIPGTLGVADHNDGSKSAIHLSDNERNLIDVANQISDKVIVLINSAIAMEFDELKDDDRVDSIVWIGLPGSYGMLGVVDVLAGNYSPSGQLPDIFAVDNSVAPSAYNFGYQSLDGENFNWNNPTYRSAWNGHYVVQAEGIYTGYRYYETRYNDCVEQKYNASSNVGVGRNGNGSWKYQDEVTYGFGYGLSYSSFSEEFVLQDNNKFYTYDSATNSLNFEVKVTNTGSFKAKHAVQLYVSTPYTDYDRSHNIEKSAIQLIDFNKTQELEPNQEETLKLSAPLKYFASYDSTLSHDGVTGGYILDSGNYYFSIGNGAHEALNNVLLTKNNDYSTRIYSEENENIDVSKVITWDAANESALSGAFSSGINSQTLAFSETGTLIQNQLQDTDYNFYLPGTIRYLSRSDWPTYVKAYPNLNTVEAMNRHLGNGSFSGHRYVTTTGTVDTKWGVDHLSEEGDEGEVLDNMVIAQFKGRTFDDAKWEYLLEQITFDEAYLFAPLGGTFCKPFKSINAPEVYQIDGPNGYINYTLGDKSPDSGILSVGPNDPNNNYISNDMCAEPTKAATFNKELLKEEGKSFGENSLWCHVPIAWAPGMNLHRCPWNSRNHEYYSEDPILTNKLGSAFVLGGLEKGAILSPKHFAFNTQENFREGLGQSFTEQYAREMELRAFQGTVEDIYYTNSLGNTIRGALGMMTSFSRAGVTDANCHEGLMINILRKEWGFKGLISTDFVSGSYYFNPLDCVVNNVTFMASGGGESWLREAGWSDYNDKQRVKKDPYVNTALKENMHYYLYAIANSSALNGIDDSTVLESDKTLKGWQIGFYVAGFTGLSLALAGFVVYATLVLKNKRIEKAEENKNENE